MRVRTIASALLAFACACASQGGRRDTISTPPTPFDPGFASGITAIHEADLRRDLFALADDSMRGRRAGTLDELRASAWIAEQARAAGLEPAGENGSYFQFWNIRRIRTSPRSSVRLDGAPVALWTEASVVTPVEATIDAPVVWLGSITNDSLARLDLHGKVAAVDLVRPANAPVSWISLRMRRYTGAAMGERLAAIRRTGAVAALLVADDSTETEFTRSAAYQRLGAFLPDSGNNAEPPHSIPTIWIRQALRPRVMSAHAASLNLEAESFTYPSVNVVARAPGRSRALAGEYVLFSGHQDHDGVLFPVNGDSIWNGADDEASVDVALLAIGRAWRQAPGERPALFVWHGAEERGLLGSRYFVSHPTVPRDSIVAVLNADMIGRNSPDSAALLGATAPHRNSKALVQAALDANRETGKFIIDTSWDAPTHPEFWYFRSDHLPYARAGIPAIFFTTLLHPDYHTPRDEPSRIDYAKLTRMTQWMYATGLRVANASARPDIDPGFHLER